MNVLVLLAGCPAENVECTAEAVPSVNVSVSASDDGDLANLALVYTVDGGEAKPCEARDDGWICGVEEAGLIEVTASADGYEDAVGEIEVGEDECHVITEDLALVLDPIAECPTEPVPAFIATVTQSDGSAVPDLSVGWAPTDTSAMPVACAAIDATTFACAEDEIEQDRFDLIASAPGFETKIVEGIEVALDAECQVPVTEEVSTTMEPSPSL